jgi:hypothetical protein
MPGLWKAWKAKKPAFHSFHESLEISPKGGEIPHSHSSDDEGGWKSGKPKSGFPLSHRLDSPVLSTNAAVGNRPTAAVGILAHGTNLHRNGLLIVGGHPCIQASAEHFRHFSSLAKNPI